MEASRPHGRIRSLALLGAALVLSFAACHRVAGIDGISPATPQADGSACNNPVECASYACDNGRCVAPPPGYVEIDGDCSGGDPCVGDATCDQGICVGNSLSCAKDGQKCLVASDCCYDDCMNGVCGYQSTSCTPTGDSCTSSSDCCSGDCGSSGTCTTGSSCGGNGSSCVANVECCSGYCDSSSGSCATCSLGQSGTSCSSDTDCCSGICASGSMTCI
jgi:hypothetical protein